MPADLDLVGFADVVGVVNGPRREPQDPSFQLNQTCDIPFLHPQLSRKGGRAISVGHRSSKRQVKDDTRSPITILHLHESRTGIGT